MNKRIGIVGAGVAGLHLGLYLAKRGVEVTIVTDRKPDDYAQLSLLNTVAHHAVTLQRERELGITHWQAPEYHYACHHHHFGLPGQTLVFRGDFEQPSRAVDYRLYLPAVMGDLAAAGASFEFRQVQHTELPLLAQRFDLLAIAVGKGSLAQVFPATPGGVPFAAPQRKLCVGLYEGIRAPDPNGVTLSVVPGECELFEIPTLTFDGMSTALLCEAIPGSAHEQLHAMSDLANPFAFQSKLLELLERYHPTIYARVDTQRFRLKGPRDLLAGALLPTIREPVTHIADKPVIALGDVHVTMDPCVGQGANVASHGAVTVGEAIMTHDSFDAAFVAQINTQRNPRVHGAFHWTNQHLRPPNPEMVAMILALSRDQALCDEFTNNFNYPERNWQNLQTPESIRAWIGPEHLAFAAQALG